MAIETAPHVIAMTAPFGSGCTTAGKILAKRLGYRVFTLSALIRERWEIEKVGQKPTRADLQALGNRIRNETGNPGFLAEAAVQKLESDKQSHGRIVFDGIKNLGEIETLKNRFGRNFYLFALECAASDRWMRVRKVYAALGLSRADFLRDNEQDRQQEYAHGQQVQLCVDQADVLINNDRRTTLGTLAKKLVNYTRLVTGEEPRYPEAQEILMNLAYSASHGSKCLKRQVGAVLVDASPGRMGEIVGQGFNENPVGTHPCVEEPRYGANKKLGKPGRCYRDIVRFDSFVQLALDKRHCPKCGKTLSVPRNEKPPWRCPNCYVDLEDFFWPERAMTLCTAVHAEAAAIMAAGIRARGTTLYTTTFPCFQCAEKIAQAGIKHIVFTEPYPDIRAFERLEIAGISFSRFDGVRSSRFDEIFSRARPYVSEQRQILAAKRKP